MYCTLAEIGTSAMLLEALPATTSNGIARASGLNPRV